MGAYHTDFVHGVSVNTFLIRKQLTNYLIEHSYISVTRDQNCSSNDSKFMMVFTIREFEPQVSRTLSIDDLIKFDGPWLYLMVMFRSFMIDFTHFPQCEVVLSYRMVIREVSRRIQGTCSEGSFRVIT